MAKQLMKGNEAIAEAAIQAGATNYFCYPITPQTEIAEYLAKRMPEVGGVFLQAESEVAASNMLYGAACTGKRVFTTSSSPGISLMMEAISYIAGTELPVVIVNIMRCGPGLGGILPSQGDYFQATKGGGHGDYHALVLAPSTIQEAADLMMDAFDLAEKYRSPVMLVGDGMIGQMMEPVEFKPRKKQTNVDKDWAVTGCKGRKPRILTSLFLDPNLLEKVNERLTARYEQMKREDVRYEEIDCTEDSELMIVAYGTMARICKSAVAEVDKEKHKIGLFRPITLFPFPEKELERAAKNIKKLLVVEMSCGQMLEDVQRIIGKEKKIHFYGRTGGNVPTPDEIIRKIKEII
jgi:2-oxoglutarate ferredoxin oxidoreductase subunit alpha